MSLVKPFKAVRPIPGLVDKVAALPYDVMSSEEARVMVKGNPYSFLHVDKAEIDLPKDIDLYDEKVYAKAKENLDKLKENKIMIQDDEPYYYIYRLNMNGRAQTGLVACASIDEYLEGSIKKHELTRADKEQDRIKHVEICNANTGPIFLTYKAEAEIDTVINDWICKNKPVYDFVAEDGVVHTVWVVDNKTTIDKIKNLFAKINALYIADGHHRNASAVKVGLKKREANKDYCPDAEFNYYLAVIFPSDQLHIMDYNRLVKNLNGHSKEEFFELLKEKFDIEEFRGEACCKPRKPHTFGMYIDKKWYLLTAKPEIIDKEDIVGALDVSILQKNLLEPILNIGDPRTDKNIDFVGGIRGLEELVQVVDSGAMTVAFSMYPTSMEELMNIADSGNIMPPKSTWFEPKLRSGIFIHELD